jgi:diguanylate cyclase (GGDEF)-like protein
MRELDLVARLGGEEFAVLCEATDAAGAQLVAERIRRELAARTFPSDQGAFRVTCSLGIAAYPLHAGDRQRLFASADQALYAAKEAGRNRVVVAPLPRASAPPPGAFDRLGREAPNPVAR